MSKSLYSAKHFTDEEAAFAFVEAHLWPDGPVCPHCGTVGQAGKLQGKTSRPGLRKCYACRKPFTVKVGTIFEDSHIAMRDWLVAIHLICSSKKGISANQLHRTLGITLKSAWFMAHRIREAFKPSGPIEPMGGEGEHIEADETYIGKKRDRPKNQWGGSGHKHRVLGLVERGGRARSFYMPSHLSKDVEDVLLRYASPVSFLNTDESPLYTRVGKRFASHGTVTHSRGQYKHGDTYTNTIEGVFSIFKRGMIGTYQHCQEQHLQRYLAEFDFRYSNRAKLGVDDEARTLKALKGAAGKRLTYRTTGGHKGVA